MAENTNPPGGAAVRAPTRFAASVDDCEVIGKTPAGLNGAFYRVGGEWWQGWH
jgi:carotenoid cleavage dioxygenase